MTSSLEGEGGGAGGGQKMTCDDMMTQGGRGGSGGCKGLMTKYPLLYVFHNNSIMRNMKEIQPGN